MVAHDLHPEYLSTKYAMELENVELVGVQHHHAHIASCLADNGESGPVIGVAFDGTGFGTDGTIWGGEFLLADLVGFTRVGRLAPVAMPGGAAAIKQPWRMAAAYLDAAGIDDFSVLSQRHEGDWSTVVTMARRGINAPLTSSAGRLLDAVAAIVGVREAINYEGQAAVELEQLADRTEKGHYRLAVLDGETLEVQGVDLVRAVADDVRAGVPGPVIAARVHNGLVDLVVRVCGQLRDRTGVDVVALSGGVFQNLLLVEGVVAGLGGAGFRVLTHSRVPPNDGGISFGQAAVAAARPFRPPVVGASTAGQNPTLDVECGIKSHTRRKSSPAYRESDVAGSYVDVRTARRLRSQSYQPSTPSPVVADRCRISTPGWTCRA